MPTEDRRVGKQLPSPVTPGTTVCYTIQIPNAVQYRAAFLGQLDVLGQAMTWDHPRDGTECAPCDEAAQLWRNALYNATWSDDCEMDMSCQDVADCIETSPAVQNAIGAVSGGSPLFGQPYAPGQPLTPSQMNAQLNVPDECGFDVFWAQADQYVEFMVSLGTDTFERLALYSEALASGKNAVGGQFIAKLKNGSTVGKVTEFINWAVGTMKNAYESADTLENRNALKCALFCAMRDDCLISIQGTLDVLNTRLGGVLSPSDLDDLPALAEAMQAIVFNPALAMDLWILFLMGTAKTAGLFGVQGIDETVQLVLAVASNDPSNDWELLCDECTDDCDEYDLKAGMQGFTALEPGYANWFPGEGFGPASAPNQARMGIQGAIGNFKSVTFYFNMSAGVDSFVAIIGYPFPPYVQDGGYESANSTVVDYELVRNQGGLAIDIGATVEGLATPLPAEWRLEKIKVCR